MIGLDPRRSRLDQFHLVKVHMILARRLRVHDRLILSLKEEARAKPRRYAAEVYFAHVLQNALSESLLMLLPPCIQKATVVPRLNYRARGEEWIGPMERQF